MTLFSVIWNVFSIKVSTILSLSTLPMWDRQFRQKRSTLNWYLDGVAGRLCGSITWLERQNRRLVEAQLNSIYVSSQIINFCFRTVQPRFRKLKLNVWLNFTQNATKQFWCTITCFFFKKWAIPGLFFFYFRLFNTQLTVYKCSMLINFCRWLDSNRASLVSEATALPTEPQPLPKP